jgi:hypothetical protein
MVYNRGTQTVDRGPRSGPPRRFWRTATVSCVSEKSELIARYVALRSAVSRYERVQPLRAAVGRKVERITNAGCVHTARDVALRSATPLSKSKTVRL